MRKRRITGALCVALAGATAQAQTPASNVTLYGVMDLGLRHGSGLSASNAPAPGASHSLGSGIHTTSRWGLRGSEDLGGGAKALFNLESGLNADTGAPANASKYFDRASWVGLQSGWGTLALGRQTTTLADAISPVDPLGMRFASFNPSIGVAALSQHGLGIEYGSAGATSGSYRLDNSLKVTGRFGGFTARAMWGIGEVASQASALSSRGVGLAWAADGLVVSGAYQRFNDANKRSLDGTTLGAAYQWGSVRLAANAGRSKAETAAGRFTVQRVLSAGTTWAATPWVDLTAAYYKVDRSRTGAADDGYGRLVAFAEYKLSRRTKLYAELDSTRWRHGFQGAANKATATGISAGVVHSF
ncbi:MAG: porin [Acidovorax sp.]|uniref:porin n=1 Tax=Acidovorax sp. TaxID=1872122 RepID=UPI0025C3A740|nr:porin [Acidovorax sp.]MCE1191440.1 porin [Acidovorax sp.]